MLTGWLVWMHAGKYTSSSSLHDGGSGGGGGGHGGSGMSRRMLESLWVTGGQVVKEEYVKAREEAATLARSR